MGNVTSIILAIPFRANAAVEEGLSGLGFSQPVFGKYTEHDIWILPSLKIGHLGGVDGLREKVAALPWRPNRGPYDQTPEHLQVLWEDDYTYQDDSWAGRTEPYSWSHETWVIE